jgi:hypothetical protein
LQEASLSASSINLPSVNKISTSPVTLPSLSESPIKLLKKKSKKINTLTPLLPITEEFIPIPGKRVDYVPSERPKTGRPKTHREGRPKSGGRKTRKRKSRKRKSRKNKK